MKNHWESAREVGAEMSAGAMAEGGCSRVDVGDESSSAGAA